MLGLGLQKDLVRLVIMMEVKGIAEKSGIRDRRWKRSSTKIRQSGLEKKKKRRYTPLSPLMRLGFPAADCLQTDCFAEPVLSVTMMISVLSMMRRTDEVLSSAREDFIPVALALMLIRCKVRIYRRTLIMQSILRYPAILSNMKLPHKARNFQPLIP